MQNITTIKEARNYAKDKFLASQFLNKNELNNDYSETLAFLDADILISQLLKKNRAWILAHYDADFSAHHEEFLELVEKRVSGLPIAYITGVKEFFGREFCVSPEVLIPKPDTEILVEEALQALKLRLFSVFAFNEIDKILFDTDSDGDSNFTNEEISVLDICTGSGCIGLSLLAELYSVLEKTDELKKILPSIKLVLGDISDSALEICKKNAEKLLSKESLEQISIRKIDLVNDSFGASYDIITANPPYVPTKLSEQLLEDGRSEPMLALDGGEDGLALIPSLAKRIKKSLKPKGTAFVEVGEYHAQKAGEIFKNAGFSKVQIIKDLNNKDRLLKIQP